MELQDLLQDPVFLASVIGLIYPRVFDLVEQAMQYLGIYEWFTTPTRKTVVAWVLAFPAAFVSLWLLSLLWPEGEEFGFEPAMILATGIVNILTSSFTLQWYKRRNLLFSSTQPVARFWGNKEAA